ncbi:MAG: S8 family serine peptidase [Thermoplasmatota archaeon]
MLPKALPRFALVAACALLALPALAGCVQKAAPTTASPSDGLSPQSTSTSPASPSNPATPSPATPSTQISAPPLAPKQANVTTNDFTPHVVVALIDTGINPYHTEFRDTSAEGQRDPSTYIPGYPAGTPAIRLHLDAPDLATALAEDKDVWASLKPHTLYWIPGTRVIGLYIVAQDGPTPGFDDDGHGTMTASRAAGATSGLAPTAKIVSIEGLADESVAWAGAQPWIDVQSNSWTYLVPGAFGFPAGQAFADAAKTMPVMVATGNGVLSQYGGVGQPSEVSATAGPADVISVGGDDNGAMTPWSGSMPDVVADACADWAADGHTMDKTRADVGNGTSSATPFVAGAAARIILEARQILHDPGTGHTQGVLASGPKSLVASGPLADGSFTLAELKDVLFHTADPQPKATRDDGNNCGVSMAPYVTAPVGYADLPAGLPTYYFIGYGEVNENTLVHALGVLHGTEKEPDRPTEDQFYGADESVRSQLH